MEWESCWRHGVLGCIGLFDLIFIILARFLPVITHESVALSEFTHIYLTQSVNFLLSLFTLFSYLFHS